MRKWNKSEVKAIGKQTDLMCWSYAKDPFIFVTRQTIEKFVSAGCKIWAASAFKGADGGLVDIPNVQMRLTNMVEWVGYAKKMKMEGVIATGWSRYNTFVSPCDGLEASLDTLVLSGKIAWDGEIPESPLVWANNFLIHCHKNGIQTSHFQSCRSAAEQLQNWRDSAFARVRNYLHQAYLSGEPERINPFRAREARKAVLESLKNVNRFAGEWEKSHKNLVPQMWIKKYALSRIEPVRKIIKSVLRSRVFLTQD